MKSNIELWIGGSLHEVDWWYFTAGEIATRLKDDTLHSIINNPYSDILVYSQIRDPTGLIATRQVLDSIRLVTARSNVLLALPYFPHSRQDKVFNPGESEARKMVLNLFRDVQILTADMHSPTDQITEISQDELLMELFTNLEKDTPLQNVAILSTDKGELPKIEKFLGKCPWDFQLIEGSKVRDPVTRKLTNFEIKGNCQGMEVWTVDDIWDSGNTNCGIADVVLEQRPSSLNAYATHGIFSGGFVEANKRFNRIVTTDTIIDMAGVAGLKENPNSFMVLHIKELFTNYAV